MKVERWMSSPAVTIPADEPASFALRKMMEHEIRRLPVVDEEGDLVGWVSDRDLRQALPPHAIPYLTEDYRPPAEDTAVRNVMKKAVAAVAPEDSIRDAAAMMHDLKITGLPVCRGRKVLGVLTVHDLLEVLLVALDHPTANVPGEGS